MKAPTLIVMAGFLAASTIHAQDYANAADDKDLHILAGIITSLGSASLIFYANHGYDFEPAEVAMIAGAASVGAGIGKEILDSMGLGTPELRDLCNTAFGGVVGVSVLMFSFAAFSAETVSIDRELRYTFLMMSASLSVPIVSHVYGQIRTDARHH